MSPGPNPPTACHPDGVTGWEAVLVVLAGVGAGGVNAVIGSGSLITFPTLLAVGYPPIVANVSNNIGVVPGSMQFSAQQSYLQPPQQQTDIVHVIRGVIEAESGAIEFYNQIVEATEGVDPVTNDMVIAILRDEEGHRRLFEGFLREYEVEGRA